MRAIVSDNACDGWARSSRLRIISAMLGTRTLRKTGSSILMDRSRFLPPAAGERSISQGQVTKAHQSNMTPSATLLAVVLRFRAREYPRSGNVTSDAAANQYQVGVSGMMIIRTTVLIMVMPGAAWAADCVATLNRDVSVNMFTQNNKWEMVPYYRTGTTFRITGGNKNPSMACQHGGGCLPHTVLNFPSRCKRTSVKLSDGDTYYGWELR
jgi:hypothetical protein